MTDLDAPLMSNVVERAIRQYVPLCFSPPIHPRTTDSLVNAVVSLVRVMENRIGTAMSNLAIRCVEAERDRDDAQKRIVELNARAEKAESNRDLHSGSMRAAHEKLSASELELAQLKDDTAALYQKYNERSTKLAEAERDNRSLVETNMRVVTERDELRNRVGELDRQRQTFVDQRELVAAKSKRIRELEDERDEQSRYIGRAKEACGLPGAHDGVFFEQLRRFGHHRQLNVFDVLARAERAESAVETERANARSLSETLEQHVKAAAELKAELGRVNEDLHNQIHYLADARRDRDHAVLRNRQLSAKHEETLAELVAEKQKFEQWSAMAFGANNQVDGKTIPAGHDISCDGSYYTTQHPVRVDRPVRFDKPPVKKWVTQREVHEMRDPKPDQKSRGLPLHALADYWDERRRLEGKPDRSRCAAELRMALLAHRAEGALDAGDAVFVTKHREPGTVEALKEACRLIFGRPAESWRATDGEATAKVWRIGQPHPSYGVAPREEDAIRGALYAALGVDEP